MKIITKKLARMIGGRMNPVERACGLAAALALSIGTSNAVLPDVLFSANSSDITTGPVVWPTTVPGGGVNLITMGEPSTATLNGTGNDEQWATNFRSTSTGYQFPGPGSASAEGWWPAGSWDSIPINGASIVVAVRPIRNGLSDGWNSVVDLFYNRLVFGLRGDDGKVQVVRNGNFYDSGANTIPNGQITVLSLVVQPTGEFKVFANGTEIMDVTDTSDMTELTAGPEWFKHYINVGRNQPDGWPTFNGNIGDVVVYKGALEDADREALEASLTTKFGTSTDYTITATELTEGGSLSPVGAILVPQQTDQTFNISTNLGYELDDVVVDTVSQGAITTYTFTDVGADHTINVTWNGLPVISGTVTDSVSTDPIYSASVSLSTNADGSEPSLTLFTDAAGDYVLPVPDPNATYYLIARKGGHVTSAVKTVMMSGSSAAGEDFALVKSLGLDPLVELDATSLSTGALTSWPNTGSLGGVFDTFDEFSTPTVVTGLAGLKAVQFNQPGQLPDTRQTMVGSVTTPPEIAGASDWTISTVVYRDDANINSENAYMCWSGRDIGGWPSSQFRTAQFCYRDNLAAVHWGADYGFDLGTPSNTEWHIVTITYDGTTETLYVDGAVQGTRSWTLNLKSDTMMMVGGAYWDGNNSGTPLQNRGEDQYWRFNGAIARVQIFDQALTADEVASIGLPSSPGDTDSDGLEDAWETSFPGILDLTYLNGNASGPGPGIGTGDYDGDGTSDSAEQSLGLDPTDSSSSFTATIVRDSETGEVTITWPSQMDLEFNVWWNDNLSSPLNEWLNLGPVTDTDGGTTESYTDMSAPFEDIGFYRIELK